MSSKKEKLEQFLLNIKRYLITFLGLVGLGSKRKVPEVPIVNPLVIKNTISKGLGFGDYDRVTQEVRFRGTNLDNLYKTLSQFVRFNDNSEGWLDVQVRYEFCYAQFKKDDFAFPKMFDHEDSPKFNEKSLMLSPDSKTLSQDEAYALLLLTAAYDKITYNNFKETEKVSERIRPLLMFPSSEYARACKRIVNELIGG